MSKLYKITKFKLSDLKKEKSVRSTKVTISDAKVEDVTLKNVKDFIGSHLSVRTGLYSGFRTEAIKTVELAEKVLRLTTKEFIYEIT